MKQFYFKYNPITGDGIGKGWTFNLENQMTVDIANGYVDLNPADYSTFDPSLYYFSGGQILPKAKLELEVTKRTIKTSGDSTIIKWGIKESINVIINGHLNKEQLTDGIEFSTNVSGTHTIQVSHPRYYSEKLIVVAEDEED